MTLTLKDGSSHSKRVDVPKGDPRDPMTEDDIAVKFIALGRDVVGEQRCGEIRECVMNLEHEPNVTRLMRLMTK